MFDLRQMLRGASLAGALAAALSLAACANQPDQSGAQANAAGQATPGSQQDFVVNVGDRVFFETDSTDLTPQSRATLDKQSQWLTNYGQYTFTIEGHADERGTREYNIALGARRAQAVRDYLVSRGIADRFETGGAQAPPVFCRRDRASTCKFLVMSAFGWLLAGF